MTESHLFGQKLYLSTILDLHSQNIVSYTISDRSALSMVTTVLDKALGLITDITGLVLHSDQSWQCQHRQYQKMLKVGCPPKHEPKGQLLGQAVMENGFLLTY